MKNNVGLAILLCLVESLEELCKSCEDNWIPECEVCIECNINSNKCHCTWLGNLVADRRRQGVWFYLSSDQGRASNIHFENIEILFQRDRIFDDAADALQDVHQVHTAFFLDFAFECIFKFLFFADSPSRKFVIAIDRRIHHQEFFLANSHRSDCNAVVRLAVEIEARVTKDGCQDLHGVAKMKFSLFLFFQTFDNGSPNCHIAG